MHIIFFMIGVSLLIALGFLAAFVWSMRTGQQDDLYTPALRMLAGLQRPVSITAGLFLLLWTLTNRGKLPGLTVSRATRWVVQPMTRFLKSKPGYSDLP